MRSIEPLDPPRGTWGFPLTVALVVAGLVVFRLVNGRGEDASSPPTDPTAPLPTLSAETAESSAPSKPPPVAPRCVEIGGEPLFVGESTKPRATSSTGAGPDPDDEIEDDLSPFAVEIGRGAVFDGGFVAGTRREAEGGAVAAVATIGFDGKGGKLVRLGRSRGDMNPPVVAGAGGVVLAALLEPNADGRAVRVARVSGGDVTWGAELAEGRDESLGLDLAVSGAGAIVVWDDVPHGGIGAVGDTKSAVMLAPLEVATARSLAGARAISRKDADADSPRAIARPGGYWVAYVAHALARRGKPGEDPTARLKDINTESDDDDGGSGEAIESAWVEVLPLDESGLPTASARAITPKDGHALAFDLELGEGGAALIAWRDDDTPTGSSGGRISSALVQLGGAIETHRLAEESLGAGVPDLLPGWLAVSGAAGTTRIAAMSPKGELLDALGPEPALGSGEPIAAGKGMLLVARPAGKAMRLMPVRCLARR